MPAGSFLRSVILDSAEGRASAVCRGLLASNARGFYSRGLLLSDFGFQMILLQLAIQRRLPNPQNAGGRQLVSAGLAKGPQNRPALEFSQRHQFILVGYALSRGILKVRWQVPDMNDGTRTQRNGALDGILQLAHVSR